MHRLILTSLFAALTFSSIATVEAKSKQHHYRGDNDREYRYYDDQWSRYGNRDRSRTIYVIERNRPVQRVVYAGDGGRYYRVVDGRRSYVTGRYYNSYPSRYYYSDGRPRVSVSISF